MNRRELLSLLTVTAAGAMYPFSFRAGAVRAMQFDGADPKKEIGPEETAAFAIFVPLGVSQQAIDAAASQLREFVKALEKDGVRIRACILPPGCEMRRLTAEEVAALEKSPDAPT